MFIFSAKATNLMFKFSRNIKKGGDIHFTAGKTLTRRLKWNGSLSLSMSDSHKSAQQMAKSQQSCSIFDTDGNNKDDVMG